MLIGVIGARTDGCLVGKPYAKELAGLADTYAWALGTDVTPLREFVGDALGRPLLAIASGGSTMAAHYAALLHRERARGLAQFATPLEVLLGGSQLHEAAALLLSASGKNKDVLAALKCCVDGDVRALATLTTQTESPLAEEARTFPRSHVFEVSAPFGKDGFLATNSLLSMCVLLARAYGVDLPACLVETSVPEIERHHVRPYFQILHGGWGSPVATDLESRLSESSIAAAQVSDYRNFGHGRHLWLARRAEQTVVVAVINPETSLLAERTCDLLPRDIPVIQLQTRRNGAAGTLELLVQSQKLVGLLGELQAFDPGRPAVPDFGRKLYHLTPSVSVSRGPAPVARKLSRSIDGDMREEVTAACTSFVRRIEASKLGAIAFDYDGTLCTRAARFGALRADLANELTRLLRGGIVIGIATGRGRSVREVFQKALPRKLWDQVVVGYYNGGEVGGLADDSVPNRDSKVEPPLDKAVDLLKRDAVITRLANLTLRRVQITVEPQGSISTDALLSYVMSIVASLEAIGVRVLASSHSVDVLAPDVTKLVVVDELKRRTEGEVLCIGDRGMWPGNDFALLTHEPSLSVDEVSGSLNTCWNLAPWGVSGPDAALLYVRAISVSKGRGVFAADGIWGRA